MQFFRMPCDTPSDSNTADALAQAERRRAILGELAELGLYLARQVSAHAAAAMSAINEDNGGDPTRAFATVSRAVRLTLAMEARNDAHILALRNGRVPLGWAGAARPVSRDPSSAADRRDITGEGRGALREHLVDREDEESFLDLPFDDGVEAIRCDLVAIAQADPSAPDLAGEGPGGPAQGQLTQPRSANPGLDRTRRDARATAGPPAPPPASSALAWAAEAHRRE